MRRALGATTALTHKCRGAGADGSLPSRRRFEDDRGAAGGAAGEDAEREVQLEAEFLSALPETDWQPHFKTCAVVGNSGTLLGRGFGAQIDAHDAVVRVCMYERRQKRVCMCVCVMCSPWAPRSERVRGPSRAAFCECRWFISRRYSAGHSPCGTSSSEVREGA